MFGRSTVYFLLVLSMCQTNLAAAQNNSQMPGPYVYQPPGVAPAYSLPETGPKVPPGTGKPEAKDPNASPVPTYSAIGSQSFGADGTSYKRVGDSVFGSDGSVSQTAGGTTIMTKPEIGRAHV